MTRSRTLHAAAALLAMTFGLVACAPAQGSDAGASDGSSDGAGVIGVALPTTADALWSRGGDALRRELIDRGYRVDLQFAASDARTQAAQVQNMLTKSVDAVVVAPLASEELAPPSAVAAEAGVPVVQFGRSLEGTGASETVAFDEQELGRAQAEALLADLADAPPAGRSSPADGSTTPASDPAPSAAVSPPTGTALVAVLVAGASDEAERSRYEAALTALRPAVDAGRIEIVSGATLEAAEVGGDAAESRAAGAEKRLRELRAGAADEAPTAVLALGDAVTRGVVTALTTSPSTPETASPTPSPMTTDGPLVPAPLVVGSGADPITVRALRDGAIDATTFADPRALVPATADLVEKLLDGADVAADVPVDGGADVSPSILRADDVEELIASGWISADEL